MIARFLLSALFFTSAISKFGSFSTLEKAVRQQGLGFLGSPITRVIAWLLPPCELLLALFLIASVWPKIVALATLGLLVVFTVPMAINVVKGNRFACNCFGQMHSNIGIGTLTRNGVMLAASLLLVLMSPLSSLPWGCNRCMDSCPKVEYLSLELFSRSMLVPGE